MIEQMRASPLFSVRRAIFAYCLVLAVSLVDMWVVHLLGIDTLGELLTQTLVHGTGCYLGYSVFAIFGKSIY